VTFAPPLDALAGEGVPEVLADGRERFRAAHGEDDQEAIIGPPAHEIVDGKNPLERAGNGAQQAGGGLRSEVFAEMGQLLYAENEQAKRDARLGKISQRLAQIQFGHGVSSNAGDAVEAGSRTTRGKFAPVGTGGLVDLLKSFHGSDN
jgi:hypothetical protein